MSVITITELSKTYQADTIPVPALKQINLTFEAGEFTAIVGPSGSGKTTLLNIIGGLDTPTSGRVVIADQEIHALGENDLIDFRKNHIGFVFQSYNLIPVLTAYENTEFVMLLQGKDAPHRRARTIEMLQAVGLADQGDRRPAQLSGGQQQRVAVARALAPGPDFILADEPTANLDTASANNLLDIMEALNKKEKSTFIFSTHDERVIHRARRVIRLVDGAVVQDEVKS